MARAAAKPHVNPVRAIPGVIAAVLRRLRVERPQAGALMAMVLVTTLIFAAVPRLFNQVSDRGLRYAVNQGAVYERNLLMTRGDQIEPGSGSDVFSHVEGTGVQFQQSLAPSIQSVIDHHTFVIDATRYQFIDGANSPFLRYMTMRYQSQIDDHIKLTQGRMPAHTDATYTLPATQTVPATPPTKIPVIEMALSQPTLDALHVKLGDTVALQADPDDRLSRTRDAGFPSDIAVHIVGVLSVPKPKDDYWYGFPAIDQASIENDEDATRVYATGIFAPNAYVDILSDTSPALLSYSFRYYVNPNSFNAGKFNALLTDMRRLDAQYGTLFSGAPSATSVTTQLTKILNQFAQQRRLTISILSLGVIGLLVIALATIGLVAAFVAEHRREPIRLLRGRGASAWQILGTQAVEGLLLSIPAAIVAAVLAALLIHSRTSAFSLYAAAGIVVATVVLLVAGLWPLARRNLGTLERAEVPLRKVSPRRVALEVFVVVIAALGIYLLRRRGLAGDSTAAATGGFDPYLAAVPVLLGLATGLVVLRLYTLPIRLLAWNASYRRDLVMFLGFRRVARQSAAAAVPLLVILLSIAISVFSSVMMHSIDVGQVNTSWQTIGADYRLDTVGVQPIPRDFTLEKVPAVKATAAAALMPNTLLSANQPLLGTVNLMALDTAGYEKVVGGTPADPHFPGALLAQPVTDDIGSAKSPIPTVVSSNWVTQGKPKSGDIYSVTFERTPVTFVIRGVIDRFSEVPSGQPFAIVPLASLSKAIGASNVGPTSLYVKAPASAEQAISDSIDVQFAPLVVNSRADKYAEVHDSPLISGAARGFEIGILLSAAYSALAVVVALALTSRARIRDLTYLRTLGLSRRQVLFLTITEQAPPVILALIAGTALGVAVTRLMKPGLDLTSFTGPDVPVPLVNDWFAIALLIIGIVGAVAIAIAIVSASAQRADVSGVLRMGDE